MTLQQVKCPRCAKLVAYTRENPYRPFCSERCKLIDLGQWADGSYRVPAENIDPNSEGLDENLQDTDENPSINSDENAD